MKGQKRSEEQQKDYIFNIFTKCRSETASSRLQVYYPILCEQIYIWCRDYLHIIEIDKMGLEIAQVINRFIKKEIISKIPDDKDSLFKYLNASIKNVKAGYFLEYNEEDSIKIPKDKKQKLRQLDDYIRGQESVLGRKLTSDESMQGISRWFKKQEYIDLWNAKDVDSINRPSNDDSNETNNLDRIESTIEDECILNNDLKAIQAAIMSVLSKKQAKTRDCYKALFTLYCIKNNLKGLYPFLDQEVIDDFYRNDKKQKQYEIYLKYHPDADKSSAEALASQLLKEFRRDLAVFLAEEKI